MTTYLLGFAITLVVLLRYFEQSRKIRVIDNGVMLPAPDIITSAVFCAIWPVAWFTIVILYVAERLKIYKPHGEQ